MEKVAEKRNEFKNIIINYSVDVLKLDKKSVVKSLSIPIPDPFSMLFMVAVEIYIEGSPYKGIFQNEYQNAMKFVTKYRKNLENKLYISPEIQKYERYKLRTTVLLDFMITFVIYNLDGLLNKGVKYFKDFQIRDQETLKEMIKSTLNAIIQIPINITNIKLIEILMIQYLFDFEIMFNRFAKPIVASIKEEEKNKTIYIDEISNWKALKEVKKQNSYNIFDHSNPDLRNAIAHQNFYVKDDQIYYKGSNRGNKFRNISLIEFKEKCIKQKVNRFCLNITWNFMEEISKLDEIDAKFFWKEIIPYLTISVLSENLTETSRKCLIETLNKIINFTKDVGIELPDVLNKFIKFCHDFYSAEKPNLKEINSKTILEFSKEVSEESEKRLFIALSRYFIFIQISSKNS